MNLMEGDELYKMIYNDVYKGNIKSDVLRLNLVEKAKESLRSYLREWNRDELTKNEFQERFGEDFSLDNTDKYLKLVKYAVQINMNQEETLCFNITFSLISSDGNWAGNYYVYFDIEGNLIDNFIDY